MPVTVYRSTDSGAPTLNGTVGALVTVLDAILVNGYGSKAAAGWTKPFSGTNKAVYRQGGGNQFYFRLQDDGLREDGSSATAGAKEAKLRGYESMTDVDSGSAPFPTTAQMATSTGPTVRKSYTADSTARAWVAIADNRTLYFFAATGDLSSVYFAFWCGEFYSLVPGDSYRAGIIVRSAENSTTNSQETFSTLAGIGTTQTGQYYVRPYSGVGTAVGGAKHGDSTKGSTSEYVGTVAFPNPADGGLYLAPITLTESGSIIRGRLRGCWQPCHAVSNFSDGQTFSGTGALAGKTFLAVKIIRGSSGSDAVLFIETSETWESN